jgi:hypothetical protein
MPNPGVERRPYRKSAGCALRFPRPAERLTVLLCRYLFRFGLDTRDHDTVVKQTELHRSIAWGIDSTGFLETVKGRRLTRRPVQAL